MSSRSLLLRYGSSASFVVFAALIRIVLQPYLALDVPFITFFVAVAASAWYNGLGPSLFATALSALMATVLFIPPFWSLDIAPGSLVPVALFCAEALTLAFFTNLLQQRTEEAQRGKEQLTASEERLRLAMEGAGMGAWDIDLATGEVRWDAKHGALFGLTEGQLPVTVEQCYALIHTSDVQRIRDAAAASLMTGCFHEEFRIVRPDGAIRWIAGKGTVLRDGQGRPLRMFGVNYDISERKEAQERTKHFAEELERQVTIRTAELSRSQEQLRALATDLNLAEQRERKRLASELHDHLAQMLVLVKLKVGQAKQGPAHRTSEMIEQAEQILNESLTYTRELVAELSPPVLQEFGLPAAIRWLGEQMKRFDLNVRLKMNAPDELPLPEDQAILLFQSTRELLINVAKHAETKEAVVDVALQDGTLRITVQDQGVGFLPSPEQHLNASSNPSKFGLFSIRERMHALGGRCEILSVPGQGTTSTLILPFSQK